MESEFYNSYLGVNEHISIFAITIRAVAMFLITFLIIRVVGMRQFRKNSPFDMVIVFLIGGVLSRGVVGATAFFSALVAAVALVLLQKLLYMLAFQNEKIEKIMKGEKFLIYKDGQFIKENMKKADITKIEVFEDLRVDLHEATLDDILEIYVEKTGEISFIKRSDH
jgi:uncharacterized membrane protein YcaP (DUF421 family)